MDIDQVKVRSTPKTRKINIFLIVKHDRVIRTVNTANVYGFPYVDWCLADLLRHPTELVIFVQTPLKLSSVQ